MTRAAIYARYSSENQRPESIDDQVAACRRLADQRRFLVRDDHVFADRAQSGALKDRPALRALNEVVQARLIDVVLVDDLSRLARDLVFMLTLVDELRFVGVRVLSVADGVDTADEHARLSLQIRGVLNEFMLADLKQKALRGQKGQKERGYFVGERTFGYRSEPAGEFRLDKHGRSRPDGYLMRVYEPEAAVVRRIFEARDAGLSLTAIARQLNADVVPGVFRPARGWSPSTISRMLANTKYIGHWLWNRTGNQRDYRTGRCRSYQKPEEEWIPRIDEALRVVPQDLWDRVQLRRGKVREVWGGGPGRRGFSDRQGSRAAVFPKYLLSGAMVCARCSRGIVLVSGKGGGYYSCSGGRLRACDNRLRVPRLRAEDIILASVRQRFLQPAVVRDLLKRVEAEVTKQSASAAGSVRQKTAECQQVRRRVARLVEFIARGRESPAVAAELADSERRLQVLESEIEGMKRVGDAAIRAPSLKWIEARLGAFRDVLEARTVESAGLLRRLLGTITLEPVHPDDGAPYYVARTALDVLVLLDPEGPGPGPDPGARSLRWWSRSVLPRRPGCPSSPPSTCVAGSRSVSPPVPGAGRHFRRPAA